MEKIAFFDSKQYDREMFNKQNTRYEITYFENKLNEKTAGFAAGYDGVCAFVNDDINKKCIEILKKCGVRVIAMRCAGYSNVDFEAAYENINVVRVPAYSPYAVAEFTMGLLLTLNRKIHKAYVRTRDYNFSLLRLMGTDLHEKTMGIIGTGKIGRIFIDICRGFGMKVIAYDAFPAENSDIDYVSLEELFRRSDAISLHCPLTKETKHILDKEAFSKMKRGVYLLNTSRGALIDTAALLDALNDGIVAGAGLDVYEEEAEYFYEDKSEQIVKDDILALLVSKPNVILTSHQAYFTEEALTNITSVTLKNLDEFFDGKPLQNEVCYNCREKVVTENCSKNENGRCF